MNTSSIASVASTFSTGSAAHFAQYSELERYFEIQRVENEAAKVIQTAWRKTRVLLPWRHAVLCQKMAQRIQKRVRGMLTRKWVAEWYHTRNSIVITWQAHSRRFVSNKHTFARLAHERAMAIRIQNVVRGRLARVRCNNILLNLAATRIQCLWRGVVGRLLTDKLWLNKVVIPVQSMYRRRLAQKRIGSIRAEFNNAAVKIQQRYRNWYSRRKLGHKLWEREMEYRLSDIRMLTSEEELCQENLTKAMERLVKNQFKEKALKATKALMDCEAEIYMKENDLTEFRRQSEILSSRAREQGFDVELAKNIKETREAVTALKLKHIFELSVDVHRADEALEDQVFEVESWAANRNRVAEWRSDQYDERRHLNYKREILERRRAKRMAIADERRRWQVHYYTADGKPDKKRRPGRPWDPSVYAGGEKAVYSGGSGVNLMAHIQLEKIRNAAGSDFKLGSLKSVDHTLQEVGLQTYLEEVNLYEQLLKPVMKVMEKAMGGLAGNGYGAVGAEVVPALVDIGAIPPPAQPAPEGAKKKKRVTIAEDASHTMSRSSLSTARSAPPTPSTLGGSQRLTLFNDSRKVAVSGIALSRQSSYNDTLSHSSRSGANAGDTTPHSSASSATGPTPYEILQAAKLKKKMARKSYLPALDAFISRYAPKEAQQTHAAGGRNTLNRLFDEQATASAASVPSALSSTVGGEARARHRDRTARANAGSMFGAQANVNTSGPRVSISAGEGNKDFPPLRRGPHQLAPLSSTVSVSASARQQQPLSVASAGGSASVGARSVSQLVSSTAQLVPAVAATDSPAQRQGTEGDAYWTDITRAAREEAEARRLEVVEKRRAKKRSLARPSTIPWELLDQLDGAKHRFENEKLYHDFNHKY